MAQIGEEMKAIALFVLILAGCATPPAHMTLGEEADPPYGWVEYCNRHPDDPACPQNQRR